jgi:cytochrome c oxidase subunit 2
VSHFLLLADKVQLAAGSAGRVVLAMGAATRLCGRRSLSIPAWGSAIALGGCERTVQSWIPASGPAADRIAELWWVMFAVAGAVLLFVLGMLVYAFFHRKGRAEPYTSGDDRGPTKWILFGGVGLPVVVLTPLFFYTLDVLGELAPPNQPGRLEVEVVGHQWWWDVHYRLGTPTERLRSANEIHIPVGKRVRVRLRSQDVIHSFWVPRLQGKMDLIPGRITTTWIQADTAGVFRGECAEYCGLQHARMAFMVVAHSPADFARWLEDQRRPASRPRDSTTALGQQVFLRSACVMCHAVRGTPAQAQVGPDLTHMASRLSLAAGTLPNTRGHLAGWIGNPQAIKPGNKMPRVPLQPEEFHSLIQYLMSLK